MSWESFSKNVKLTMKNWTLKRTRSPVVMRKSPHSESLQSTWGRKVMMLNTDCFKS